MVLWAVGSIQEADSNNTSPPIIADLCAAPGSKSLQLLDMLHTESNGGIPSGLLVVNDSDRNRIITLCQRSRHVPRAPMLAINMDARYFPGIRRRICNSRGKTTGKANSETKAPTHMREKAGYKQKYDMVLCDVPCSGDGTTRKNKQIWDTWSMTHAMSLHRLQRKILRRAMELLTPSGIVVYSTCSLNPIEDEAVVASVIDDVGGASAAEIVPLPKSLTKKCAALKGLATWQVPHPKFGRNNSDMYKSFVDVPTEHQGGFEVQGATKKGKGGQINQSMFPPDSTSALSQQLQNCCRFIPNDNLDSGGFFVGCIKRLQVGELRVAKDETPKANPTCKVEKGDAKEERQRKIKATAVCVKDTADSKQSTTSTADMSDQREGDWICQSCKEVNFAKRARCFSCKARKHHSLNKDKAEKAHLPLLTQPKESLLEAFIDFFGLIKPSFPLDNTFVIHRKKEQVMVVVSESLSKLSIGNTWSPV